MDKYTLMGFVSTDLLTKISCSPMPASERIGYMLPVVRIDGSNYMAVTEDWKVDTLVELTELDEFTPVLSGSEVSEGEVIWYAGNGFVKDALLASVAGNFMLNLFDWNKLDDGSAWVVGKPEDYCHLATGLSSKLYKSIKRLFKRTDKTSLRFAYQAMDLYSRIDIPCKAEVFAQKAGILLALDRKDEYISLKEEASSRGLLGDIDERDPVWNS